VDTIGGYEDALHAAAKRAGLGKTFDVRVLEPDLSFTDQLLVNLRGSAVKVLRGLGYRDAGAAALATQLSPQLKPLQRELLRWQRLAATPGRTLAYCFCAAD